MPKASTKQKGGKKAKKSGKQQKPQRQSKQAAKQATRQAQKKPKAKVSDNVARSKAKATSKASQTRLQSQRRLNLIIRSKFQNPSKATPNSLEIKICEYLVDLEAGSEDLRDHLRDLGIVNAREIMVDRAQTKKAIVILVPMSQHTRWQKMQDRVQTELEKKFSGKDVIFIANRKVMKLNQIKNNYPRPRTQTITAVHEQMLKDVVFPIKIVGKRTRFRVGGTRLLKVYLEPKDSKDVEARIPTFEAVYRKLTKNNVRFLFPRYVI